MVMAIMDFCRAHSCDSIFPHEFLLPNRIGAYINSQFARISIFIFVTYMIDGVVINSLLTAFDSRVGI